MHNSAKKIIKITPKSKRNRLFLFSLGCLLLFGGLLLADFFWQTYTMQLMLLLLASFILILIAVLKYFEPQTSYQITPESIIYTHRSGQWQLPWQDIIRIGDMHIAVNGEYLQLPYLGIRLKSLENIASNISPRLANKLIHEQKELIFLALKTQQLTLSSGLINFEPYQLNGVIYQGPVAAWLYRSEQLATAYGYHLYLPESSFDRELHAFLSLLKQCQNYTQRHSASY